MENDVTARRRAAALGGVTGFGLALVVSCGIVLQRLTGATAASSVTANAVTTLAAVVAVLATVRTFLTSFNPASFDPRTRERRIRSLVLGQTLGALLGIVATHAVLLHGLDAHPWLREHPRQLVNDLVAIFGVLAFVWGCAQKPIRPQVMIAGLGLVLGYELTAGYWHLDAPIPVTEELAWSIQRFVGGEVTASGIGVLTFRLLFA
jgi:hypothetical protein